jgi:predicted site-specific integrase-resolvase
MAALPRFVPLPKAAEQLAMSEDELRRMIDTGRIDAIALSDGDVAVNEKEVNRQSSVSSLPRFVPLPQAAKQLAMSEDELRRVIESGKIDAITLPNGNLAINEKDMDKSIQTKEDLPEYRKFDYLANQFTWASKAERDYGIPNQTINRWTKDGLIEIAGTKGNKKLLNAQDVAYCALIYKRYKKSGTQGRRIFNDDGTPYKPKTGPFSDELPKAA